MTADATGPDGGGPDNAADAADRPGEGAGPRSPWEDPAVIERASAILRRVLARERARQRQAETGNDSGNDSGGENGNDAA